MNIKGGSGGQPGNQFDLGDEGIFISKINPNGAAARDGRLQPGMRIIEVNDNSLLGATHKDAVEVLRTAGNRIILLVCDGYDPSEAAARAPLGTALAVVTNNGRLSETNSSSHSSVTSPETTAPVIPFESRDDDEVFVERTRQYEPKANESPQLHHSSSMSPKEQKTTTVIMKKHQSSMVRT